MNEVDDHVVLSFIPKHVIFNYSKCFSSRHCSQPTDGIDFDSAITDLPIESDTSVGRTQCLLNSIKIAIFKNDDYFITHKSLNFCSTQEILAV